MNATANRIAITLTRTQLNRLSDVVPNIRDYLDADGNLQDTCTAYALGMRTSAELEELIAIAGPIRGPRRTIAVTPVQARVLHDRLLMVWEIASDNVCEDGDEFAIAARRYRDGMDRIDAALAKVSA
jgi:hypothetical protein